MSLKYHIVIWYYVIMNITTTSLWCYIPKLLGKCLHFRSNLIKVLSPSTFYFFLRLFPLTVFQLVSVTEIRIPLTEIRIPLTENRILLTTTKIPWTKIRIPLTEFRIPIIEIIIPLTEIRISLTGIWIPLTEIRIPLNEIPQTEFQFSPVVIEFPIANF